MILIWSEDISKMSFWNPQKILESIDGSIPPQCVLSKGRGGFLCSPHCWITFWSPAAAAAAKSLQSCLTLCDPIDGSPPGSPVPRILQARTLEWVAISFSNAWRWKVKVKSLSHVRLSDIMDSSLPGSSVHGIFQARALEWGAIAFSTGVLIHAQLPWWLRG